MKKVLLITGGLAVAYIAYRNREKLANAAKDFTAQIVAAYADYREELAAEKPTPVRLPNDVEDFLADPSLGTVRSRPERP